MIGSLHSQMYFYGVSGDYVSFTLYQNHQNNLRNKPSPKASGIMDISEINVAYFQSEIILHILSFDYS